MPFTLPPITLTQNKTSLVNLPGNLGSVSHLKLVNASPYLLQVFNLLGGSDYMQPGEANVWPTPGLTTAVQVTPQQFGINPVIIPSSVLTVTWYLEGEQPAGHYPVNFSALSYIGNTVMANSATNTIEQDMWTPFVLTGIVPSFTGFNLYSTTAGIAFPRQVDGSLLRTAVGATAQNLTTPSATYYHDLNPDGTFSLGTAHSTQANYLTIATITTDAGDNITNVTDTRLLSTTLFNSMSLTAGAPGPVMYNLHVNRNLQVDNAVSVQGTIQETSGSTGKGYQQYIGGNDELLFMPTGSSTAQGVVFYGWFTGSPGFALPLFSIGSTANVGAAYVDTGGVLHATAPVTLIAGNQETGVAGYATVASGAGQNPSLIVNFKTVMTNTPSSVTSSNLSAPTNASNLLFNLFTRYGFNLFWTTGAAGISGWNIQYTTVGNCLLAVDTVAGTFDHHCEGCGAVHRGVPLAQLARATGTTPAESALSYTCPACATMEHFNCALTNADEADPAPQGSGQYATTRGAQATLIRQLQAALGQPTAAATAPLAP